MANTSPKAQRPAENEDATSPAKPVATFRYGGVSAAIFTDKVKTKNGKSLDVYNVSLRRSYRKADGQWSPSRSLRSADLLPASLALQKCYEFLNDVQDVEESE